MTTKILQEITSANSTQSETVRLINKEADKQANAESKDNKPDLVELRKKRADKQAKDVMDKVLSNKNDSKDTLNKVLAPKKKKD